MPLSSTRIVKNYHSYADNDSISNYNIQEGTIIKSLHYNSDEQDTGDSATDVVKTEVILKSPRGIFGMPYQFLKTVDRRLNNTNIGAKYSEKIVAKMPLLFMVPCKQKFMDGYSKEEKSITISKVEIF